MAALHDNPPVAMRSHMGTWIMATCLICTGQFISKDTESALRRFDAHYERSCVGPPR